jgi:hypothetical protein
MVIDSEYNLIPYSGHDYQVQPYIQDHPIANHQRQQEPLECRTLLQRSYSKISVAARRFDHPSNLYDFKLFLQQPAFDQIGLMVDVYA